MAAPSSGESLSPSEGRQGARRPQGKVQDRSEDRQGVETACRQHCCVDDWQLIEAAPWNSQDKHKPKWGELLPLFKGFGAKRQVAPEQAKSLFKIHNWKAL